MVQDQQGPQITGDHLNKLFAQNPDAGKDMKIILMEEEILALRHRIGELEGNSTNGVVGAANELSEVSS